MKCGRILKWLLGIWLVETVAARHILNGEDTGNKQSHRVGRDQFHPFYQQPAHLNYNSFRSPLRRAPPQVPGQRNLAEEEVSNNGQQYYNNYFTNDHPSQNQQNVYSAVRLHGALEARARNEPGSNTLLPTTHHFNYYNTQQESRRPATADRHVRRDDDSVDGESYEERGGHDDLARFSLYNSYFDNEHSIKALNSMRCVTPTGSTGFCSTFRGCVPSFFTKEGDLEAPALAELISTSIGYCTTNVTHHFIREQRQQYLAQPNSREERRFNSVANRIICCPGVTPVKDPNLDPDKIFNDYIESQRRKNTTTTTTPPVPEESENVVDGSSDSPVSIGSGTHDPSVSQPPQHPDQDAPIEENVVNDSQSPQNQEQSGSDTQQVQHPEMEPTIVAPVSDGSSTTQSGQSQQPDNESVNLDEGQSSNQQHEQTGSSDSTIYPSTDNIVNQQDQSSTMGSIMYPTEGADKQQQEQSSTTGSSMYPDNMVSQPSVESSSQSQSEQTEGGPNEISSPASGQSPSTPEQVPGGVEESSLQPVETEGPSAPAVQPPSDDESAESSSPAGVESSSSGSQQTSPGKFPPKTQASSIIKIYPEPVSGVNGKFTLPGGIYIITSTDTPNNNQPKPVHPSAGEQVVGGGETIVGSKPIIIVTSPGGSISLPEGEMPKLPNFPSDFPPMDSQENVVPPVDDSSLELQQRPRPQLPISNTNNLPSSTPSMPYPSSSSSSGTEYPQTTASSNGIVNDEQQQPVAETTTDNYMQYPSSGQPEAQATTNVPQQDESIGTGTTQRIMSSGSQQQDESDVQTTALPMESQLVDQQGIASGDSSNSGITPTTNVPPFSDDEADENDALTIIPINENPSEKSSGSSTTEIVNAAAGGTEIAATTVKSQSVNAEGQEQVATTIPSTSVVGIQEVESDNTPSPAVVSGSQDSGIEATTVLDREQQQITTFPPDLDESDESSEEVRATQGPVGEEESDIQKTTIAPAMNNDFVAPTTTVNTPVSINHDEESDQDEESLPGTTAASAQQHVEGEFTTAAPSRQQQGSNAGGETMYPPGSNVGGEFTTVSPSRQQQGSNVGGETMYPPGISVGGEFTTVPSSQQHDDNFEGEIMYPPGSNGGGQMTYPPGSSVGGELTTVAPSQQQQQDDHVEGEMTYPPGSNVGGEFTTVAPSQQQQDEHVEGEMTYPPGSSVGGEPTTLVPSQQQGSFDKEIMYPPGSNMGGELTTAPPSQQQQGINAGDETMYPPGSESNTPEMQYPTNVPPKIILNPGSDGAEANNESGPNRVDPGATPSQNDESINGDQIQEALQPFPVTSPATPGEAGSEQQQLFPGDESSGDQSERESVPTALPTTINDQPFPESESSTTVSTDASNSQQQSDAGSEQSISTNEASTASESTPASNDGGFAGIPTTVSPVSTDIEQDSVSGSGSSVDGDSTLIPGGEQSNSDGANTSNEPPIVSGTTGSDGTNESTGVSGSESLPIGGESSSQGSEPIATGTESPNTGNEPSAPGASDQADEPASPGSESLVSEPAAATTATPSSGVSSPSSQSPDSSNQGSESSSVASTGDNEPISVPEYVSTEQPHESSSVPSHDEPASSAGDSVDTDDKSFISSTTVPTATGGPVETEGVSQESVSSVPPATAEDASPVQGSVPEADSPVSSDIMQDPQPGVSTSEVPEDVSSPASVASSSSDMSDMYPPSTAAPVESTLSPENAMPNYQILKACKFQSFFRSVNDMAYSYRHYPWLATIVGGTRPFSSGTLITDRHILTASHFLANITVSDVFNMRIHVGYRTSYSGQTEGPYAVRKVRKVIRHKGFSFEKLYNDIAVLVLDRPVRFSEDIYPVCISSNRSAYADGTVEAFETGWIEDPRAYTISQHHNYVDPHIQKYFSFGYKNITWRLQEAPQRVRTNTECQSNYNFLEKNGIMVTDSMVCAGSGDTRSCAFRGNSGAPLFLRNDNDRMTEQIGIVSFGIGCGHFPFVFTRLESFLPWLDRVVYNSR